MKDKNSIRWLVKNWIVFMGFFIIGVIAFVISANESGITKGESIIIVLFSLNFLGIAVLYLFKKVWIGLEMIWDYILKDSNMDWLSSILSALPPLLISIYCIIIMLSKGEIVIGLLVSISNLLFVLPIAILLIKGFINRYKE